MLKLWPRLEKSRQRRRALDRGAHGIAIVFDDEDDGKLPQLGHIEAFVDLPLVGRAVAEIGVGDVSIVAIAIGEGKAGAERHLRADDAVAAVEMFLFREHVHRAALAFRQAAAPPCEFGHDPFGIHAAGDHMAVVAIARDGLVAGLRRHHDADDDRLLADVEMAKSADKAHAVELAGLFLEAADQSASCEGVELFLLREGRRREAFSFGASVDSAPGFERVAAADASVMRGPLQRNAERTARPKNLTQLAVKSERAALLFRLDRAHDYVFAA